MFCKVVHGESSALGEVGPAMMVVVATYLPWAAGGGGSGREGVGSPPFLNKLAKKKKKGRLQVCFCREGRGWRFEKREDEGGSRRREKRVWEVGEEKGQKKEGRGKKEEVLQLGDYLWVRRLLLLLIVATTIPYYHTIQCSIGGGAPETGKPLAALVGRTGKWATSG